MTAENLKETEKKDVVMQTEFSQFRDNINRRLDEIIEKTKPQFTSAQVTGFLLTLVAMLAGAMIYITDVKSDTRVNTVKTVNNEDDIEDLEQIQALQYNNIDGKLDILIKDVAVLKAENN